MLLVLNSVAVCLIGLCKITICVGMFFSCFWYKWLRRYFLHVLLLSVCVGVTSLTWSVSHTNLYVGVFYLCFWYPSVQRSNVTMNWCVVVMCETGINLCRDGWSLCIKLELYWSEINSSGEYEAVSTDDAKKVQRLRIIDYMKKTVIAMELQLKVNKMCRIYL